MGGVKKLDLVDKAFQNFQKVIGDLPNFQSTLVSEADVRLKILDTILTNVLGWSKADIQTEEKAGQGFLDYKLTIEGIAKVVIEAKRTERSFNLNSRICGGTYKLSGPILKNSDVQEGINQAIEYSAYKGTELACVTNGIEWVVFRSNRIGDGTDTLEGKAFIFESLVCVKDEFSLFYDLLAKERVLNLTYRGLFQEAEGRIIRHSGFQRTLRNPAKAVFLSQSIDMPEFDRLMTSFFQRLSDEHDREMVEFCFVETKESKAAEQRLVRLADELVGHIQTLNTDSGIQLADLLERARDASLNQFILVVGTKGSGKSTFIQRFFNSRLPPALRQSCIPIIVNLSDSDGDENKIIEWLRYNLLTKAEAAVGNETLTWDELIGHMFFSEYQRWSITIMPELYKKDKEQFKIEFGKHIESIRENDPVAYLRGLLKNFIKGRKLLPCLVFDNADHFSIEFQDRVFQFARSLYEQELCVVIMPITDKTSWQLSGQGALNSFENEALLLPTPSAKHVLEKRINYVLKKMEEGIAKESGSYFIGKGIRVNVNDIFKFVKTLQEIFLNTSKTANVLGQLANHNVRDVLELTRGLVNSPHIGLEQEFKAYVLNNAIHIPPYNVERALIRGRYDIFALTSNKYVHNIFELNTELETTPLLGIRILQALKDAEVRFGDSRTRFMNKDDLIGYIQAIGIDRRVIEIWLDAMLKAGLIFNYDPTQVDVSKATQLEISPCGKLHLFWACGSYVFLESMAEVTAIFDEPSYIGIENADRSQGKQRMHEIIQEFMKYLMKEDHVFCRVPDHASYEGQKKLLEKLQGIQ